ncbi:hypothetical protein M2373_001575 [Chryseobacterium sp. JUb7]|nr:hypothetical protein [Chryseobacterium sp. JUb7]
MLIYKDGVYETNSFETKSGDIYTLSVTVDGVEYKAVSQMPESVPLSGLKQTTVYNGYEDDTGIVPVFKDPQMAGNYYLFKSHINSSNKIGYTVFSDYSDNGEVNKKPIKTGYLMKSDTVVVKMMCIDAPVYNYLKALPNVTLDTLGESVTPTNPPSNFSNGALGYFSAHTSSFDGIIIQ